MKQMSTSTKMNSKRRSEDGHSAHVEGICHASSQSKRQKAVKTSRKNDDVAEEENDVLASILPLRLTVLSGYLPLRDTGRLLLRVSKDMAMSIFGDRVSLDDAGAADADRSDGIKDSGGGVVASNSSDPSYVGDNNHRILRFKALEQVWKTLCRQKWRNPKVFKHLVSILGGENDADGREVTTDWEKLFRQFLQTTPKPAIRASVNDYSFVFTLMLGSRHNSDSTTPLTSYVLRGDKASEFLKTGESGWLELDEHIKVANFASKKEFENSWSSKSGDMTSTLHACELNFEEGLEMFPPDGDEIEFFFGGGDIELVGNFIEIIDIDQMELMLGFTISRSLRGKLLGQDDGSVDFRITHTYFSAKLFPPDGRGDSYSWYSERGRVKSGATVADILEQLKWE